MFSCGRIAGLFCCELTYREIYGSDGGGGGIFNGTYRWMLLF